MNVRSLDAVALEVINSATKYPSIPTYHPLNPATKYPSLSDGQTVFEGWSGLVLLTEKVDGTNARIVQFPDGSYLIGSRERLLCASGDLIGDPQLGIVETLRPVADRLAASVSPTTGVVQISYLEVFGGNIGGSAKQYTSENRVSYRLFDVAEIPAPASTMTREQAASWRDHGGQRFYAEHELGWFQQRSGLTLVPRIDVGDASQLPTDLLGTQAWLDQVLPTTRVALDPAAGSRPEGIVLRDARRTRIAKARFADYSRTLRGIESAAQRQGR